MEATAPAWQNRIVRYADAPPEELTAHPLNFRVHPKHQQAALRGVLDQVGIVQNVIVNERTGRIIDGHLRVTMAIDQNQPTVPVTFVDLEEAEESVILATLDPISALAGTDRDLLSGLLDDIRASDVDFVHLVEPVWHEISAIPTPGLTDPDSAPELPKDPITQPGDLWLLGDHRLLCGDSTIPEHVARLMKGERSPLMPTDPPYLVDYNGGNHPQTWRNAPRGKEESRKDKHWDDYVEGASAEFFVDFLKVALAEALTENPAIYQFHATRRQMLVEQAWLANNLLVHQSLIWVKARAILTRSDYMWQHEPCFYGWISGKRPTLHPPSNATTVWQVGQAGESDGIHPTQKPTELIRRMIGYHTRPGEIVYEPFGGSGTAIIASQMLDRRCNCMEISPAFCDVIVERWQSFTGQQATREENHGS